MIMRLRTENMLWIDKFSSTSSLVDINFYSWNLAFYWRI